MHTNDAQFCINGIFSPDRKPHATVSEIKYLQQPIQMVGDFMSGMKQRRISSRAEYLDFTFINRCHTLSWSDVYAEYFYCTDNCSGAVGDVDCAAFEPSSEEKMKKFPFFPIGCNGLAEVRVHTLDNARPHLSGNQRCWVVFRWYYRSQRYWEANKENPIAVERIELCPSRVNSYENADIERLRREEGSSIRVQEASSSVEIWVRSKSEKYMRKCAIIDKATGCLTSFCDQDGSELLLEPLLPNITRACTDNDRGGVDRVKDLMPRWVSFKIQLVEQFFKYSFWYRWKRVGLDPQSPPKPQCEVIKLSQEFEDSIVIDTIISIVSSEDQMLCKFNVVYRFRCDGCVKIIVTVEPRYGTLGGSMLSLPRIGFSFCMNKTFRDLIYLGKGKGENYPDRKAGSEIGLWSYQPQSGCDYIVPSEHGNRCDCSWLCCRDSNLAGFLFIAAHDGLGRSHFDFSALLHNQKELHIATHNHQLEERETGIHPIYVNLDMFSMGIGGDVGWDPCVYDDFLLKPDKVYKSR